MKEVRWLFLFVLFPSASVPPLGTAQPFQHFSKKTSLSFLLLLGRSGRSELRLRSDQCLLFPELEFLSLLFPGMHVTQNLGLLIIF